MTTDPTPLHDVNTLVTSLLGVQDAIAELQERAAHIKAQLADRIGVGNAATVGDVHVTVREPNRRFNLDRALGMLTDEQRAACLAPDAAKVRKQLPEVLLEQCYEAGKGAPIVSVK